MTALLSTSTLWGVRHAGSPTGVDKRADELDARLWLRRLEFCGHRDADLVARAAPDAAWIPVGGA